MWNEYEKIIDMIDDHIGRYPYSYWKRQALEELKQEMLQERDNEIREFESHRHDGQGDAYAECHRPY